MQDTDFDRGVWAIVAAPTYGQIIGRLHFNELVTSVDVPEEDAATQAFTQSIIDRIPVLIDPCFGFKADAVMVQTPEGPGTTFFRQCTPFGNFDGPGRVHTIITGGTLFSEMGNEPQKRHKDIVEQLMKQVVAARARQAGIVLAGPGGITRGASG